MTLNVDLVRRAKAFTGNLSETVEGLLAAYAAAEGGIIRLEGPDHNICVGTAMAVNGGPPLDRKPLSATAAISPALHRPFSSQKAQAAQIWGGDHAI